MPVLQRTRTPEVASSLPRAPDRRRFAPQRRSAPPTPSDLERLGLLTASVAHDFNNLLSVIMICAGEIADAAAEEEQRERADEIRAAAERGAGLSKRLLDQGLPERVAVEPIDVDVAIIDSLPLLRRTLSEATDLSLTSGGGVPHVPLAPGELERMLLNLAANSRDALGDGGVVAVRTALVQVPPGDPILPVGWCARIGFSDDGAGMSPDVARRAVHPYFSTKEEGKGTGLGLATVQAIARSRGGDLRISTTPGSGTTVAIYLPAVRSSGEPLSLNRRRGARERSPAAALPPRPQAVRSPPLGGD